MRNRLIAISIAMATMMAFSSLGHAESDCAAAIRAAEKAIRDQVGVHPQRVAAAERLLERAKNLQSRGVPTGCSKVAERARDVVRG